MYHTVVFDLDGTLLDTLQDLADAANWTCGQMGWPTHPLERYRYFVGNGIPNLVQRFAPEAARTPEQLARALALFQRRYAAHKADKTRPYPGVKALLQCLTQAGVAFGVVTNKDHDAAQAVVQTYFAPLHFPVQGRVEGAPLKPDPTGTLALLRTLGADPANTLFVGDSNVDIATARNAGLDSCGVLWGFRTRQELTEAGATYLAPDPQALEQRILQD